MVQFAGWNDWFGFRRRINSYRRINAIPFTLLSLPINYLMMTSPWLDPTKPVFGVDPVIFIGVSFLGTAAAGFLIGSSIPMGYLRCLKPQVYREYNDRLRKFYHKIVKYRANVPTDPSKLTQNIDFYGEKIGSISDYRKWLRRHHEIRRSCTFNL